MSFLAKIADRLIVVFTVFLAIQLPLFMHDYEMRLSGHVSEAKRFVDELQVDAQASQKTLSELIQKFVKQEDPDFSSHGMLLKRTVDRYNKLSGALNAIASAGIMTRPFVFMRYLQMDIFYETIKSFQLGFSLTIETMLYGFMGLLFGMWAAHLLLSRKRPSQKEERSSQALSR